jgi:hypothetical protein
MTEKTLPEIYREAADLVEAHGKTEGGYGSKDCGFCTMGAVLFAAGRTYRDKFPEIEIESDEFSRLIKPVASLLVKSGRTAPYAAEDETTKNVDLFCTVYNWNDRFEDSPTAQDVAALLRETAESIEEVSA